MIIDLEKEKVYYLVKNDLESPDPGLWFNKKYFHEDAHRDVFMCSWSHYLNDIKFIISNDEIDDYKNDINDTGNIKVNFATDCIFPRNIFSLFNNIKKTNNIKNADYIIVDKNYEFGDGYLHTLSCATTEDIYIYYNKKDNEYLYISYFPFSINDEKSYIELLRKHDIINDDYELFFKGQTQFITQENKDLFNILINNKNKVVYNRDFSRFIISKLPELTSDILNNIKTLFLSKDRGNIQIAFKILSGYNFLQKACEISETLYKASHEVGYFPPCVASRFVLDNLNLYSWCSIQRDSLYNAINLSMANTTSDDDYNYGRNIIKKFIECNIEFCCKSAIKKFRLCNFTYEYTLK